MEKIALKCDVCDAPLVMGEDGTFATCEYCGMKYAIERLRAKIQGAVTIEGEVKTSRADFEIEAGVLKKYNGKETTVVVPDDVKAIGESCFSNMRYLEKVILPEGLVEIGSWAFSGCENLREINFPESLRKISDWAFNDCISLVEVKLPEELELIGNEAFDKCKNLEKINIPICVSFYARDTYQGSIFGGCVKLKKVEISEAALERLMPEVNYDSIYWRWNVFDDGENSAPWYLELRENVIEEIKRRWREEDRCQYCGGELTGIFTQKCKRCFKKKDY